MNIPETTGKKINFGIDITSFIIICSLLLNFGKADPGDIIFVFVYESTIMVLVFALFFILFHTFESMKFDSNKHHNIIVRFFGCLTLSTIMMLIALVASFIIILFLNQLTVEFLVGFLKNSDFHFKSIEILNSNGVYLTSETRSKMEILFGKSYNLFFWIIGVKYFVNLTVNYFSQAKDTIAKDGTATFSGLLETAIQIIISPIVMLITCIILVILAEIFGPQTWIVFVCLGIFRLLFMYSFSKFSNFMKNL
jgi:uncharacterized membrane protein YecN with MAPEG domain